MGCCFKKKTNLLLNEDLYNYEVDDFIVYSTEELLIFEEKKVRKLVKLLLSNDVYQYSKFLDKVLSFGKDDLQKLFEGDGDYEYSQISIYEKGDFNLLIIKFDNYHFILEEWYRDESKHKYLNKLWKNYISMSYFKYKDINEIRDEVQNIMNFSYSENEIKEELVNLINNSPETKANELKNFIRKKRPDFYELINTTATYQKKIEESMIENKNKFIDNLKFIAKNGFDSLSKLFKDFIEKNGGYKNISKSLINKFQKVLFNSLKSQAGFDNYGFESILNLSKGFKTFISISDKISKYFSSTSLCLTNLSLSFFNLCTSIIDFYQCFQDFDKNKNEYSNRLKEIHDDFERHKNEIKKFTNLKNTDEYINNIIEIGRKISQDKQNVLELIREIESEIERVEKKKGSSIAAIVFGSIGFVFSLVGAVFTGGATAITYGVAAIINLANVGVSSGNIVQIKNQIKEYQSILENANQEYIAIEEEIESLVKMCNKRYDEYLPINLLI